MEMQIKSMMGGLCFLFAIISLSIVLMLEFSTEYNNGRPGILSDSILRFSAIFYKKEECPEYPAIKPIRGIFLIEQEEKLVLRAAVVCFCLLSFALGVMVEKNKGNLLWVPGGVLFSGESLFILYPEFALVLILIVFLLFLKLRGKDWMLIRKKV